MTKHSSRLAPSGFCQPTVTHFESSTRRVFELIALCTECLSISLSWGFWVSILIVQCLLKLRLKHNTKPEVLSERIMGTFPNSYTKPQREQIKQKKHSGNNYHPKKKKTHPEQRNRILAFLSTLWVAHGGRHQEL